jgi:hypothetical protein
MTANLDLYTGVEQCSGSTQRRVQPTLTTETQWLSISPGDDASSQTYAPAKAPTP